MRLLYFCLIPGGGVHYYNDSGPPPFADSYEMDGDEYYISADDDKQPSPDQYQHQYHQQRQCHSTHASGDSLDMTPTTTPHGSPQAKQRLGKHLSKSASELNGHSTTSPRVSPKRAKSAASPHSTGPMTSNTSGAASGVIHATTSGQSATMSGASGVLQKTHGFFSNLRHRFGRARSKDRFIGRKSPNNFLEENSNKYSGEYSSENSSITQSRRYRSKTISGSPLARDFKATTKTAQIIQRFGGSMEAQIDEDSEIDQETRTQHYLSSKQMETLQVHLHIY